MLTWHAVHLNAKCRRAWPFARMLPCTAAVDVDAGRPSFRSCLCSQDSIPLSATASASYKGHMASALTCLRWFASFPIDPSCCRVRCEALRSCSLFVRCGEARDAYQYDQAASILPVDMDCPCVCTHARRCYDMAQPKAASALEVCMQPLLPSVYVAQPKGWTLPRGLHQQHMLSYTDSLGTLPGGLSLALAMNAFF